MKMKIKMNYKHVASLAMLIAGLLALVATPASAQDTTRQVYALPGTLRLATDQPFATYLVTSDATLYGLAGETPAVEAQITALRNQGPNTQVKVWGTLYPNGRLSTSPEIVVSSIQGDDAAASATATPAPTAVAAGLPVATVDTDILNVRSGPNTTYPVIGQLTRNQSCPVVGRNLSSSWWQLRCSDTLNGWVSATLVDVSGSTINVPVTDTSLPPPPATPTSTPAVVGWTASYFANRNLTGAPVLVQTVPSVNFDWGTGSPAPSIPADNFSIRFQRSVNFPAGTYRFTLTYDDGARLYLDGQLILDDWRDGSLRSSTVDRAIAAGNHTVTIEYYEATGGAAVQFTWATVGGGSVAPTPVPPSSSVVIPAVPGNGDWQVTYWNNPDISGAPVYARIEPRSSYPIDHNWGSASPVPGVVNVDNWSARYVANYYLDAGDYTFEVESDDGVRVYLDGQRVIDAWSDGYKKVNNTFRGVGAGNHQIKVEFYERQGTAQLRVRWWKNNQDDHLDE